MDIRVLAATNLDPLQAVQDGKLREDLYYRLNVFRIDLPPLRERRDDIELLARHFLQSRHLQLDAAALQALQEYAWPGNVRELANILERAAIMCSGDTITLRQLPADLLQKSADITPAPAGDSETELPKLPDAVTALEKSLIQAALMQTQGNKSKAAKLLGISERSLWYKLGTYSNVEAPTQTGVDQS